MKTSVEVRKARGGRGYILRIRANGKVTESFDVFATRNAAQNIARRIEISERAAKR